MHSINPLTRKNSTPSTTTSTHAEDGGHAVMKTAGAAGGTEAGGQRQGDRGGGQRWGTEGRTEAGDRGRGQRQLERSSYRRQG